MVITTAANKKNSVQCRYSVLFAALLPVYTASAQQSGIDITGQIDAQVTNRTVQSEAIGSITETLFITQPQINFSYAGPTVSGIFSGTLVHFERDVERLEQRNTYGEYNYLGNLQLIDNVFSLQASGALTYQNAQLGNFFVNDFLNDQGQLVKTRSNRLSAIANIENGDYVRGQGTLAYLQARSEENPFFNGFALNNDAYTAQGVLIQGDKIRGMAWRVQGSYVDSEQEVAEGQVFALGGGNFENRQVIGDIDVSVIGRWAFRLAAQHEGNQIDNPEAGFRNTREFNTYGAGITYRQSDNRFVSITYNTTDSDIERDDGENFVGLDLNWAFSERTNVRARYTRRFFGESGSANFSYNTKRFRSNLTYSEDVTTNALLIADPINLGTFVCPTGESAINQCFQPNSLNYQPQAGEQFVQFGSQNLIIDDNVVLRKALNSTIGYSFTRLTFSFFGSYAEETFLDADAIRRTISGAINVSYRIGSYTNIVSRVNYAEAIGRGEANQNTFGFFPGESNTWNTSIGMNRQIGQNLTFNTSINYIDQSGDLPQGALFGGDFKDRRITAGLVYRFR